VAAVAVSGLLGALVAVAALWSRPAARTPAPEATARVSVMVPANRPISISGSPTRSLALSPDGTQLVYVGTNADGPADPQGRRTQLMVRSLDTLAVRDLPGTAGARQPFFSPDGQWVGFFTQTGELRKIGLAGGTPVTLVEKIEGSGSSFGVWTAQGAIAFGTPSTGLRRVSAEGGAVTELTTLDVANREASHSFPVLTPSGRAVLFVVRTGSLGLRTEAVMFDTGARRQVVENARPLLVLSSGHLAFERDDAVLVAPFDLDGLAVTGAAVPLVDAVRRSATSVTSAPTAELAASKSGTLAYVPAIDAASALGLVGPEGTFETLGPPPGDVSRPRVSPDGNAIAFLAARGQDLDVQVFDRRRGSTTRVTQDEVAFGVAWHPDGRSLAIVHPTKDSAGIFLKPLDGREQLLATVPPGAFIRSLVWSPDGSQLAYTVQTGFLHDIWILTMGDPPVTKPFLSRQASEYSPAFSPDGRWLAYVSDESGRAEVYLQPYPAGERLAVSTAGGSGPVWRRDGKALFYQGLDAGVSKMMAVTVTPDGASLALGRPTALFDQRVRGGSGAAEQYMQSSNTGVAYDVLPDGRFVMVRVADLSGSREFVLVQHWLEELKRLVPVP
jgi:eukaryotic-like serine/threonine-protein kinase